MINQLAKRKQRQQRKWAEAKYKYRISPDFPLPTLPDFLFNAVNSASMVLQTPFELTNQATLGYMSTVAQCGFDVRIAEHLKPKPLTLHFITVAESGDRKTGADSLINAPLYEYNNQLEADYEAKLAAYSVELGIWKVKNQTLKKKLKKSLENEEDTTEIEELLRASLSGKPPEPVREQLLFSDTTLRGLTEALPEHNASACLLSSEAGGILKRAMASDFTSWCGMWDGDDITINRVKGRRLIHAPRVVVSLMVQPVFLEQLLSSPTSLLRLSGYAARVLFCRPSTLKGTRFRDPAEQGQPDLSALHKLHETGARLLQESRNKKERTVLTIKNMYHFNEIYNDIEAEQIAGGMFAEFSDAGSKFQEIIARMAGVIYVFSDDYAEGSPEIPERYVNAAGDICFWYMKQFMALFNEDAPMVRRAVQLMDWLDKREYLPRWQQGFYATRLLNQISKPLRKVSILNELVEVMQELYPYDYFYIFDPDTGAVKYIFTKNQQIPDCAVNGKGQRRW